MWWTWLAAAFEERVTFAWLGWMSIWIDKAIYTSSSAAMVKSNTCCFLLSSMWVKLIYIFNKSIMVSTMSVFYLSWALVNHILPKSISSSVTRRRLCTLYTGGKRRTSYDTHPGWEIPSTDVIWQYTGKEVVKAGYHKEASAYKINLQAKKVKLFTTKIVYMCLLC